MILVDAQHRATVLACPPYVFSFYECRLTMLLEVYQILDHTHLMLFDIAFFQAFQFVARELWAFIAVFEFCLFMFSAGFEPTFHTIAAFVGAIAQTPPAGVFFPQVCLADSAEDAARCNLIYGKTHFEPSPACVL
jgi:hypothetical protein